MAPPSWIKSAVWLTVSLPTSVSSTPWCYRAEPQPAPPMPCLQLQMPPPARPSTWHPGADRPSPLSPHTLRFPIFVRIERPGRYMSTWLELVWAAGERRIWRSWRLWRLLLLLETRLWAPTAAHLPPLPQKLNTTSCCWDTTVRAPPLSKVGHSIPFLLNF